MAHLSGPSYHPFMEWIIFGGILIGLPLLILILIYNGFISRRNDMRNAFASIDVQLKKRWDLIPNLVETVKGFAAHEKELFESTIAARNAASNQLPESGARFAEEQKLTASVGRLIAIAEDYPDLKSGAQFLNLQRNLTEIESQISAARRAYNAAVQAWNNKVEAFPGALFAKFWNFQRAEWFEVRNQERGRVDIEL